MVIQNSIHQQRQHGDRVYESDACFILPPRYLPTSRILNLDSLTVILSIELRHVKFVMGGTNDWNYRRSRCLGRIRTQHPLKLSHFLSHEWTLSDVQLKECKRSRVGQRWASTKFGVWFLMLAPNGLSGTSKGQCMLTLNLIELPEHLGMLTAVVRLKCNEYEWEHTAGLRYAVC